MTHLFPTHDVSRILHIEATPDLLSTLWRAARGTPYHSHLRQHSSNRDHVFTPKAPHATHGLKADASYYRVSRGLTGLFDTTIEFGVIRAMPGSVPWAHNFQCVEAARISILKRRNNNVAVGISTGLATRAKPVMLGLGSPDTREMAEKVLRVFGEVSGDIYYGHPVDFTLVKETLQRDGLPTVGVANPALFSRVDSKLRVA